MQLEVCCGGGLVEAAPPVCWCRIQFYSLGMTFFPSFFLRQDSLCSPARSRVRSRCVFPDIKSSRCCQGHEDLNRVQCCSQLWPHKAPPAVADPKRDPLGFCMEFLPFPIEPSWLVLPSRGWASPRSLPEGGAVFGHRCCYPVMSELVHPGFTGGHFPLEVKGRAGWGRWGWQHSHTCSTSLQRAPWNTRSHGQQDLLA